MLLSLSFVIDVSSYLFLTLRNILIFDWIQTQKEKFSDDSLHLFLFSDIFIFIFLFLALLALDAVRAFL